MNAPNGEVPLKAGDALLQQYSAILATEIAARLKPMMIAASEAKFEKRLLSVEEAADYLGRTPDAVRLMVNRRKLPATKIDNRLQLDRRALDKVIDDATFYCS